MERMSIQRERLKKGLDVDEIPDKLDDEEYTIVKQSDILAIIE